MTDQEIIKWLRLEFQRSYEVDALNYKFAADRIELLTAESQKDGEEILYLRERAEQLAKAVDALRHTLDKPRSAEQTYVGLFSDVMWEIRAVLAELEGEG